MMSQTRPTLAAKEAAVRTLVRSLEGCIVAFSGGVDSALVLKIARDELGDRALGVTAVSESLPDGELQAAAALARALGARFESVPTRELDDPRYLANPANRCYFCKAELYTVLSSVARREGVGWIVDGFNVDDAKDRRPGRKAAREFAVRSPLAETGFSKSDVRALAAQLQLDVWDKPALACLSSRFPYGTAISVELLRKVDRAERAVRECGFETVRVRHHGDVARVEIPQTDLARACEPGVRERIVTGVEAAGYRFVALDLAGYVAGNLNRSRHG